MHKSSWLVLLAILLLRYVTNVYAFSLASFMEPEALDAMRKSKDMDKFIKYLGIPDTSLCHPDTDETSDPMFNEDLRFGDLIMDEESEKYDEEEDDTNNAEHDFSSDMNSDDTGETSGKKKQKWEDGVIPYYISDDYTPDQKQTIEKAIKSMNSELRRVKFRPYNRLTDNNYVLIFSGKGCYAKLGMTGGQQPISLQADKCLKTGVIQHELMHAVGFSHEQNRPDRDYYIQILYENIPEKWWKEYELYKASDAAYVGKYDYYSVMHYPVQAPKSDGKKRAIKVLDSTVDAKDIGNREGLSDLDIQKINTYYS